MNHSMGESNKTFDDDIASFDEQMNSLITPEDDRQKYCSVDMTPEKHTLPQPVDKAVIELNIEKVKNGINWTAIKTAEAL